MCLVSASFTEMMGYFSAPSLAMARSRITPVVVSSVPPITPSRTSFLLVGAIVHGDMRFVIERRQDVAVIGVIVLALDGEDGNVVIPHQRHGHVILRTQRVGRAENYFSASIAHRDRQVCGFRRDMQARRDADAFERLVLDEVLADGLQHLHGLVRPLDALLSEIGKLDILYIAGWCGRRGG